MHVTINKVNESQWMHDHNEGKLWEHNNKLINFLLRFVKFGVMKRRRWWQWYHYLNLPQSINIHFKRSMQEEYSDFLINIIINFQLCTIYPKC